MKLTVGMPHHSDFYGVDMTLNCLLENHDLTDTELLVIDNSPDNEHGQQVAKLCEKLGVSYYPYEEKFGTAAAKNQVFRRATGQSVLLIDCHVRILNDGVRKFREWMETDSDDLFTGPLVKDGLQGWYTHFDLQWRNRMWGTWGTAWVTPDGRYFSLSNKDLVAGIFRPITLETFPKDFDIGYSPVVKGHEKALIARGFRPVGEDDYFDIPAQGCGLMGCRKSAWRGFNDEFEGFGGEEGYIHEKFRSTGNRVRFLPFLQWRHRFGKVGRKGYSINAFDPARNYLIGFRELGLDTNLVRDAFVPGSLPEEVWGKIVSNTAVRPLDVARSKPARLAKPLPNPNIDIGTLFNWLPRHSEFSPVQLDEMRRCAKNSDSVLELTTRRETTVAFLAGLPKNITSVQREVDGLRPLVTDLAKRSGVDISSFNIGTSYDTVYFDFESGGVPVESKFKLFATRAKKYLLVYGVRQFGAVGPKGEAGYEPSLRSWCDQHPEWALVNYDPHGGGLLTLSKAETPEKEITLWLPRRGPGTELKKILEKFGIRAKKDCGCSGYADVMDLKGPAWCLANLGEVTERLKNQAKKNKSLFLAPVARRMVIQAVSNAVTGREQMSLFLQVCRVLNKLRGR